ncbi:lysostaphin resistance A-like protein [Clostridium sp. JNZ X4-2]
MYKLNPFKIISNIENGTVEFKKMGIQDCIVATLIYGIILVFIGGLFIKTNINSLLKSFISNSLMALLIFVVTTILFYGLYVTPVNGKNICEKIAKKITMKNIFYLTVAVVGFKIISNDLVVFILDPFSKILMPKFILKAMSEVTQISFLMYVCIIGPAMEELVFRGVVLGGLLNTYSAKKSIIISAILFGISHLNGIQFINAFLLGVFMGYIYVKTKSIYLCMYTHVLFNSIGFTLIYLPKIQNLIVIISITILGCLFMIYGLNKINNFIYVQK